MPQSTMDIVLQYIWVPIVTGMVWLWGRVFGVDSRTSLLEQQAEHYRAQRIEDQRRHSKERDEILNKIDAHHQVMYDKLEQVDKRIKNGH